MFPFPLALERGGYYPPVRPRFKPRAQQEISLFGGPSRRSTEPAALTSYLCATTTITSAVVASEARIPVIA